MQPVKALNHIGIAVRSIEDQRSFYGETLGAEFEHIEEVPSQKVKVAFFRVNDVRLELLEPTSDDSPIAKFLDIQSRIDELKDAGLRMIDETPRSGAHQMQIAFLHPKSSHGVLTELCEPAAAH